MVVLDDGNIFQNRFFSLSLNFSLELSISNPENIRSCLFLSLHIYFLTFLLSSMLCVRDIRASQLQISDGNSFISLLSLILKDKVMLKRRSEQVLPSPVLFSFSCQMYKRICAFHPFIFRCFFSSLVIVCFVNITINCCILCYIYLFFSYQSMCKNLCDVTGEQLNSDSKHLLLLFSLLCYALVFISERKKAKRNSVSIDVCT